ncbi:hypothetical protein BDN72DRAFT_158164 [Pluteus cervinus]|uniref:Uncharacterized protein n=1 Tax=Pluteus cervinus TaxID=181527 RepID=A0ACD3AL02_9AGAR|nr:hypothetical protein BDN72DRAFT_158164 [Pluteus cervinus]
MKNPQMRRAQLLTYRSILKLVTRARIVADTRLTRLLASMIRSASSENLRPIVQQTVKRATFSFVRHELRIHHVEVLKENSHQIWKQGTQGWTCPQGRLNTSTRSRDCDASASVICRVLCMYLRWPRCNHVSLVF